MEAWWITALGTLAGICTTGSLVPQVTKCWREGDTQAVSLRMYLVLTTGFVLWIVYGAIITSWPIIIFNSISLGLGLVMLWLKIRGGKSDARPVSRPA